MILIWRESLTERSPIIAHPGPAIPSDTNPFARDPPSPPDGGAEPPSPSGLPTAHLKSRVHKVGNSQFVNYERRPIPTQEHGVPPNFPDDQLERGKGRIPPWGWWLGGMFVFSVIEDVFMARAREKKKSEAQQREEAEAVSGVRGVQAGRRAMTEAEREERIAQGAGERDEALQRAAEGGQGPAGWSERMRAMNAQRAQVEASSRQLQSSIQNPPGQEGQGQGQWGDGGNNAPSTDFYGRG